MMFEWLKKLFGFGKQNKSIRLESNNAIQEHEVVLRSSDIPLVKCGYCGKTMNINEWRDHQYSHGKPDRISITYKSNGQIKGRY